MSNPHRPDSSAASRLSQSSDMQQFLGFALGALSLGACTDVPTVTALSAVQYSIASPLCGGSAFTFVFSADGTALGTESLKNGQLSKVYMLTSGTHVISAPFASASVSLDTTVTLVAGKSFNRVVEMYCS